MSSDKEPVMNLLCQLVAIENCFNFQIKKTSEELHQIYTFITLKDVSSYKHIQTHGQIS